MDERGEVCPHEILYDILPEQFRNSWCSMIDVLADNVNCKLDESKFNYLISFLSEEKRKRVRNYFRLEDAQRSLVVDILARTVACKSLGIRKNDIVFDYNDYGKPFLRDFHDFQFNISHAGEWVVCATHTLPVGIDIEYVRPNQFDIARSFFLKKDIMI